jgi:hypothetical protein
MVQDIALSLKNLLVPQKKGISSVERPSAFHEGPCTID